ncbi:alpha/beta hydrolase family protein [Deinococcus apachensis]|uniref:alpha/beta hydrolase family protein n=1 Tax=Deinococcus apachensis TaxID=309886 RepID=UPI00037CC48E|nr:alpha/beta fold hydrolase [Deinococcus apachensis]
MPPVSPPVIHAEQAIPGGTRVRLEWRVEGDPVPAVLLLPEVEPGVRVPAALLLHGLTSRGEVMTDSVGRVLLRRGVASLAPDLPLHGSRGHPLGLDSLRNPLEAARLWRLALREAGVAVEFLRTHPAVDPGRVAVVGYSLGSFLATALAARHREVGALVLAAGGDLPLGTPLTTLARTALDPIRAVRQLGGRPLLMVHGRHDPVIRPDQAERLYAAAREPKELRWWNAGHSLPTAAIEDAADWLTRHLGVGASGQVG